MTSNARSLEKVLENYELIINNDYHFAIYLSNQDEISIINFALNSPKLGLLCLWEIFEKYLLLLNYELMLL